MNNKELMKQGQERSAMFAKRNLYIKQVKFEAVVSGLVNMGQEVQFLLPSGVFFYLPYDDAMKVIDHE